MGNRIKNQWHWEILKLIIKHLMGKKSGEKIIDQGVINNLKNNKALAIKTLKQVIIADRHLQVAVNQFNYAKEKEEIDESIYFMQESEEEFQRALDMAKERLIQLI
ncbi:hypothetical protein NSA47_13750 [Irregularibacter muris]|uniref:Uncharacterized protein n=1 Tax=Irregularibacter muris TaxID=1796619 RepID=A0AAE3HIX9_9FIRM|nr:hypothetical protein [Irregularibacter muris]MCR1900028.1 hypothetical protein [Irregularibacter muris]